MNELLKQVCGNLGIEMAKYGVYAQQSGCVFNPENPLCGNIMIDIEFVSFEDAINWCDKNDDDGIRINSLGGDEREYYYMPVIMINGKWYETNKSGNAITSDYFGKSVIHHHGQWHYEDGQLYDKESYYIA